MRRTVFAILLMIAATSAAWARNITIGWIQYLGTNSQGISAFKVTLNTAGITESPLKFANATLAANTTAESTGPIATPVEILFLGGGGLPMASCPCNSVSFELLFPAAGQPLTFRLVDGEWFTARPMNRSLLRPLRGQRFLVPGQSAPITLASLPERRVPERPVPSRVKPY